MAEKKRYVDLNMQGQKVTNLPLPTQNGDAATKQYVDSAGGGSAGLNYNQKVVWGNYTVDPTDEILNFRSCDSVIVPDADASLAGRVIYLSGTALLSGETIDVEEVSGNQIGVWQATPTSFGALVCEESDLSVYQWRIIDLEAKKIKWQKKVMTSANTPNQLKFDNLEMGKTYKLILALRIFNQVSKDLTIDVIDPDGTTEILSSVGLSQSAATGTTLVPRFSIETIFKAQASGSLYFVFTASTGALQSGTYAILEELPGHEEVSIW